MAVGSKIKALFWTDADAPAAARVPATAPPRAGAAVSAPTGALSAPTGAASARAAAPTSAAAGSQAPDLAGIAANVEQRLAALESGLATEQQRVRERQQARAHAVQSATTKVQAEIKALEDRATQLRKQLATATAEAQTQDTTDQQQLSAFVERARAEAVRLAALRDFIARGASQ